MVTPLGGPDLLYTSMMIGCVAYRLYGGYPPESPDRQAGVGVIMCGGGQI